LQFFNGSRNGVARQHLLTFMLAALASDLMKAMAMAVVACLLMLHARSPLTCFD